MSRRPVLLAACAAQSPDPSTLLQGAGDAAGVIGLERLEAAGPCLSGAKERSRLHVDAQEGERVTWSASAGLLAASGRAAEWTLPRESVAQLFADVVRRDGRMGRVTWEFVFTGGVGASAQAALLATPMPVIDGGTLEVTGGACDVQYEGTTSNLAIAFTSETHPSVTYGRWNGAAWTLEVIDGMGFNVGGVISTFVTLKEAWNGTPHLLYVRSSQLIYATRSSTDTWTRERVDTSTFTLATWSEPRLPSLSLDGSGTPVVLFASTDATSGGYVRPGVTVRTGSSSWSLSSAHPSAVSSTSNLYPVGELVIEGTRFIFPVQGTTFGRTHLYSVAAGVASSLVLSSTSSNAFGTFADSALAGSNRVLFSGSGSVWDLSINTSSFSSSTSSESRTESSGGTASGAIAADAAGKPWVVALHGGSLESLWTKAAGYWLRADLGAADATQIDASVDGANQTRACFVRSGRLMIYRGRSQGAPWTPAPQAC